uniref:Orcokinin peptides type B-like n=1 Tax=Dermatophagoides pteronyssinus TaxID=6956 RepID=A0A6P6XT32_DERPT|nr:orcokinin peptides type B-like [Dermatophagoides pteronyssinus]
MDGELTRIIEQIKSKNNKFNLITPNKLTAKQYISILDNYSSGEVSARLASIFSSSPSLLSLNNVVGGGSGRRNRRSSFDSMTGLSIGYSKRRFDPMIGLLPTKRGMNFDEMDHSGFAGFAKRGIVDFDEMDHSGFAGFNKRRSADFDEMDHSGFAGFSKRRNFDEMDHSGFAGFAKRFNDFDEIDRSGFNGFAKLIVGLTP